MSSIIFSLLAGAQSLNPNLQINNISAMLVGDPDQLLGYTSSSPGAVTYSSSNTNVATIVTYGGNSYLRAIATGSVSVTANQAASGSYLSGSSTSNTVTLNLLDAFKSNMKSAMSTSQLFSTSTVAVRVRRSSDNTEQDFGFVNYVLDTVGIASFIGGGTGYITKWYDQSGNSNHASQATQANQPQIHFNAQGTFAGILFDGATSFLTTTSFLDSSYNTSFSSIGLQNKATNSFTLSESCNMSGGGAYYHTRQNDGQGNDTFSYNNSGFAGGGLGYNCLNNTVVQIMQETFTYNGVNRVAYCNTVSYKTLPNTEPLQLSGTMYIGNLTGSGFWWNGDIFTKIYMNVGCTATQVSQIGKKLAGDFGLIQKPFLLFSGNSLTSGIGSTGGLNYPQQTVNTIGSSLVTFFNQGAPGGTTEQLISAYQGVNIYQTNGFCRKLVFIFWEGTNSMYTGDNGTTAYNVMLPYFTVIKGLGYKIVLLNCLPRTDFPAGNLPNPSGVTQSQWLIEQATYNGLVSTNHASISDEFADVNATVLGVLADVGDPTYWDDGSTGAGQPAVHLVNNGYAVVAGVVAPLVQLLIN